jgi:Carboxypeptidase regulatory-like domain
MSWHFFRDLELAEGDDVLVEFVVSNGNTVAGDVVDSDGEPVPGAWVNVRPVGDDAAQRKGDELEATSDSAGHFELSHLSAGRVRISASTSELVMTGEAAGIETEPGRNDLRLVLGRGPN